MDVILGFMVSMDSTPTLPDDSSSLKHIILELVATQKGKDRQIDQLEHRLELLLRSYYGRSYEKINPEELLPALRALFEQEEEEAVPVKQEEPAETKTIVYERKKPGHGRNKISTHLPREQKIYVLSEAEKQ